MSEHIDSAAPVAGTSATGEFGGGDAGLTSRNPPHGRTAARPGPAAAAPSSQEVQSAVQRINEHLASVSRVLELQVDPQTGLTVATVRRSDTGELLLQYPAADSLRLAQMLAAWSHGGNVLLDMIA